MRTLFPILLGGLTAFFLLRFFPIVLDGPPSPVPEPIVQDPAFGDRPLVADVLEVRDASLFAGACHLASECGSQGRDALVAVSIDSGVHGGVDLTGVRALLAVSAEDNLATDAPRRSQLWVDGREGQPSAVASWLRQERPGLVGELLGTHRSEVRVETSGNRTVVSIPGLARIDVRAITDGSCCTMPERRLYDPLVSSTSETVVGYASTCSFEGTDFLERWSYADANNAHVGRIEPKDSCRSRCESSAGSCASPSACSSTSYPAP